MPNQDEILDVLQLARNLNTDIQAFNNGSLVGDNQEKLRVTIVDPNKVLANIDKAVVTRAAPPPPMPPIRTMDGYAVPPPAPLIPMPEGYQLPTPPPVLNITPSPATPSSQLEFNFPTVPVNEFLKSPIGKYLEENITIITVKLALIDSKLSELVSRKRKKYERRIKPVAEGLGKP